MIVGAVIAPMVIVHLTAERLLLCCIVDCAEFEGSSVWRSGFQDEAIY